MVLLPLVLSFQVESSLVRDPLVVGLTIVAVALLLVSRLPTFSFKNVRVSQGFVLPTMLLVGLVAAFSVSAPWLTLTIILCLYIASLPFAPRAFNKLEREAAKLAPSEDGHQERKNTSGD